MISGMRFSSFHAVIGILSVGMELFFLLFHASLTSEVWRMTITGIIVSAALMAISATPIIKQAPMSSWIFDPKWNIMAPHQDAFRRTIAMVLYLTARICINCASGWTDIESIVVILKFLLGGWIYLHLVPMEKFDNLNTWFFGVPMFTGAVLDTWFLDVKGTIVSIPFLVLMLLVANVISFAFTLAFRKHLDTSLVYVMSVLCVLGAFGTLLPALFRVIIEA